MWDDTGFGSSVFSVFWENLLRCEIEKLLLDKLLGRFRECGLVKERGRQRTDLTHIQDAVRILKWLEAVGETLCHVFNRLVEVALPWLKQLVPLER